MAFLALASQKSFKQLEQISLINQINITEQQMANIKAAYPEDYDNSYDYIMLEQMDEEYGAQKDALEDELNEINQMIQSLTSSVKTEIQNSCKLNYAGGS